MDLGGNLRTILLESERRTLSTKPSTSLGHLLEESDEEKSHASLRQVQQRRSTMQLKERRTLKKRKRSPAFLVTQRRITDTLSLPSGLSLSFYGAFHPSAILLHFHCVATCQFPLPSNLIQNYFINEILNPKE